MYTHAIDVGVIAKVKSLDELRRKLHVHEYMSLYDPEAGLLFTSDMHIFCNRWCTVTESIRGGRYLWFRVQFLDADIIVTGDYLYSVQMFEYITPNDWEYTDADISTFPGFHEISSGVGHETLG